MKLISTDQAAQAIGPYSQAVEISRWVFTSGQIGIDPKTKQLVKDSFALEVQKALDNLRAILSEAGCGVQDVIKTTVFLTDMNSFKEFNGLYETFMGGHKPARSTVQVAALPLGARFEIEAVAIIP